MGWGWWRQRLPPRLPPWPTPEQLRRMARHPSAYAPTADEVLNPPPVPPPVVAMSAAERALMDAILADPDADAPRLRYADWVEASDPDRAAFIRGQLLSGGRQPPESDARGADAPRSEWTAVFAPWGARDVVFRRGFAEAMSLTGRSFVSLSDGLFAATPLRDVRLIAVNFLMADLVRCPNLAKLRRLDLWANDIGPGGAAVLAGCEHLGHLRELDLTRNALTDAGARALLAAPWVRGLDALHIGDNELSPEVEAELRAVLGPRVTFADRALHPA